jgi:hypothetical protein
MQDSQIAVLIDSHGCELKYTFELPKNIRLFYRTGSGTTAPALSNNDVFSFFQMFGITPDNNRWLKKQNLLSIGKRKREGSVSYVENIKLEDGSENIEVPDMIFIGNPGGVQNYLNTHAEGFKNIMIALQKNNQFPIANKQILNENIYLSDIIQSINEKFSNNIINIYINACRVDCSKEDEEIYMEKIKEQASEEQEFEELEKKLEEILEEL